MGGGTPTSFSLRRALTGTGISQAWWAGWPEVGADFTKLTLGGGGPSAYWRWRFRFPFKNELRDADSRGRPREWSGVEWRGGGGAAEWSGGAVEWSGGEYLVNSRLPVYHVNI